MTKRSAKDIMQTLTPNKSGNRYDAAWNDFMNYLSKNERPVEDDYIEYFDYMKNVKKYASSSIWSYYSMLNNKHQILYGEKLQKYPRITMLLKSY